MYIYLCDNALLKQDGQEKPRATAFREIFKKLKKHKVGQKHLLFPQTYDTENTFHIITLPFILFIHSSNDRYEEFINDLINKVESDDIVNSWIISFSGEHGIPEVYNNIETKEFKNIKHYEQISPYQDKFPDYWNIYEFIKSAINNKEDPFAHLELKPTPILESLSILCQTYLLINDKDYAKRELGEEYIDRVKANNNAIEEAKCRMWQETFKEVEQLEKKIKSECSDKIDFDNSNISSLVTSINIKKEVDLNTVSTSYDEIKSIIGV